ncbi:MAG: ornithine carbamoyltransferase [Firmicutes bacterium]|nr:ornithine carbamoyltransferase [Bacillota bacterium]MCL5040460.1 ornithine carbamoyltransferase [Bacillota bacterium]
MAINMKGKDLISIHDLSQEEVWQILKTTEFLKTIQKTGDVYQPLKGKTLGMIFTKASTRTRVAFEVAIWQLGGHGLFLSAQDLQLRRGETIADTARVLSRYLDGIMIRTFDHNDVIELARYASIPVINGLTDLLHPTQALADIFTIYEKKGRLEGIKLTYVGDGNNVAHSLMFAGAKVGMQVTIATPPGYQPDPAIVAQAQEDARKTGASIQLAQDPHAAVRGADVIYTDVWASMGQEAEHDRRVKDLGDYQVNPRLMQEAGEGVLFMHCLPAHRGEEVTDEVADSPQSVIFDEAENRLHVHKAILALVM